MGNQPAVLGAEPAVRIRVMFTPLNSLHTSAGALGDTRGEFNRMMKSIWFTLYSRSTGKLTTSAFEHVFMGEVRNSTG